MLGPLGFLPMQRTVVFLSFSLVPLGLTKRRSNTLCVQEIFPQVGKPPPVFETTPVGLRPYKAINGFGGFSSSGGTKGLRVLDFWNFGRGAFRCQERHGRNRLGKSRLGPTIAEWKKALNVFFVFVFSPRVFYGMCYYMVSSRVLWFLRYVPWYLLEF